MIPASNIQTGLRIKLSAPRTTNDNGKKVVLVLEMN